MNSRNHPVKLLPFASLLFLFAFANLVSAQSAPVPRPSPTPSLEKKFFENILKDQRDIWLAPFHLHQSSARWVAPIGLATVALVATDRHTSGALVDNGDNLDRLRISRDISRLGSLYVTGGIAAGFYFTGRIVHNDRARETGLLGAEALIDSGIVSQILKVTTQRQRPPVDNSSGEFFDGGSSFPSGHAISSWALASVISQEYGSHHHWVPFAVYGLASAVSISRYTGRNHFLSDVLVGSAMGYGIGHYVYRKHHDSSLDSESTLRTSPLLRSELFPRINPLYNPRARVYGAALAWNF